MEKTLHLFDLDYTLWKTEAKLAVIDKNEPSKIIYRIPMYEVVFMKDYYKKFDLEVSYNGFNWYLSDKLWDEIKSINKKIELSDIGISYREFTNEEILEKQVFNTEYLLDNLRHLKDVDTEIGLVTARCNKNNHSKNLEVLIDKIEKTIHKKVNKIYFVNDIDNNFSSDITSYRKAKIVLEYLIGFKIKGDKFIDLKQNVYNNVSFYDDDTKNIEAVQNLQFILEKLLSRTDLELKKDILGKLKNDNPVFNTYLITQNKVHPFIKKEQKLLFSNYIKMFENFSK